MYETHKRVRLGGERLSTVAWCGSLFCLIVLSLAPQTGWVVQRCLRGQSVFPFAAPSSREEAQAEYRQKAAIVALHPEDAAQSLAFAVLTDPTAPSTRQEQSAGATYVMQILERLWKLREQYSHEPSLDAAYLRYACYVAPIIGRKEEQMALYTATRAEAKRRLKNLPPIDKRSIDAENRIVSLWRPRTPFARRFLAAAEAGERLDPTNGFFPTMKMCVLIAQNRDAEALSALSRAAAKPTWDDYAADEETGKLRLTENSSGRSTSAERTARWSFQNQPWISTIDPAIAVTEAEAIAREQRGDTVGGLQIRKIIARLGMRLRVAGQRGAINESGIQMTSLAGNRPGGSPSWSPEMPYQTGGPAYNPYIKYLTRIGQRKESRWFAAEEQAAHQVKNIIYDGAYARTYRNPRLIQARLWLSLSSLVAPLCWTIVLGVVSTYLSRSPRVREGQRVSPIGVWAFWVAVLIPTVFFFLYGIANGIGQGDEDTRKTGLLATALVTPIVICGPLLLFWRASSGIMRQPHWRAFGAAAKQYFATLFALLVVGTLLVSPLLLLATEPVSVMANNGAYIWSFAEDRGRVWLRFLILGIIPLFIVVLAIVTRRQRLPLSIGLIRSGKKLAMPLTLVSTAAFALLVLATAKGEDRLRTDDELRLVHEGRYFAAKAGLPWPEATPEETRVLP